MDEEDSLLPLREVLCGLVGFGEDLDRVELEHPGVEDRHRFLQLELLALFELEEDVFVAEPVVAGREVDLGKADESTGCGKKARNISRASG